MLSGQVTEKFNRELQKIFQRMILMSYHKKKSGCNKRIGCNNLVLMKPCNDLRDAYAQVAVSLEREGRRSKQPLYLFRELKTELRRTYQDRMQELSDTIDKLAPQLLPELKENPQLGTCTNKSSAASLVLLIYKEFQGLKPRSSRELERRLDIIKDKYWHFFR